MVHRPSFGITLDTSSQDPLFQQLFEQIAIRIHDGTLPSGFRLPPTRELAKDVGTHRNTVVRAYAELESAGFVRSTVGRGTFVERVRSTKATSREPTGESHIPWASRLTSIAHAEGMHRPPPSALGSSREIIDLYRMQPSDDLLPHDNFRRCIDHVMRTRGAETMRYSPVEGVRRLRQAVVEDLTRQGVPITEDDVLITNGSQQALDLLARLLVEPDDAVGIDRAVYTGASQAFIMARAKLIAIASDRQGMSTARLAAYGRGDLRVVYTMPNQSNPTGARMSLERRKEILDWSRVTQTPLIEDDYAADLVLSDVPPPPALRALDRDVLYVGTFSKRLMPGLRVGYIVAPPDVMRSLTAIKRGTDLSTSPLMQFALAEFLERGYLRAHLNRTLPIYRKKRDALENALAKHLPKDVHFRHVEHGVTLWLELPAQVSADAIAAAAAREGVVVAAGTTFAVEHGPIHGLRIVFSRESENRLIEAAKRLGQVLDKALRAKTRTTEESPALSP